MKKLIILFFIFWKSAALAQPQHIFDEMITSPVWEIIGELKFKYVDDYEYYPTFTPKLKALAGKTVDLEGYMVPIREGVTHKRFFLSTLPINQCFFCGQNGIPIMIEVELAEPMRFTYNTIRIRGEVKLNDKNAAEITPIYILNSKLLK